MNSRESLVIIYNYILYINKNKKTIYLHKFLGQQYESSEAIVEELVE